MEAAHWFFCILPSLVQWERRSLEMVCSLQRCCCCCLETTWVGKVGSEGWFRSPPPLCIPTAPCFGPSVSCTHSLLWNDGYLESLHITEAIIVMNTSGRGCAGTGMGGKAGHINPPGCGRIYPRALLHSSLVWKGSGRDKGSWESKSWQGKAAPLRGLRGAHHANSVCTVDSISWGQKDFQGIKPVFSGIP